MDISKTFIRSAFTRSAFTVMALSLSLIASNNGAQARSHKHSKKDDALLIAGLPFTGKKKVQTDDTEGNKDDDKDAKKAEKKKAKELKKGKDGDQEKDTATAKTAAPAGKQAAPAAKAANVKPAPDAKAATEKSTTKSATTTTKTVDTKHATTTAPGTASQTSLTTSSKTEETTVVEAAEAPPVFVPDAALISLLKDLNKSLSDPEQMEKIEDANEKSVIELGKRVLAKALENAELKSNRIVDTKAGAPMTTEAWSSGDIKLAENCHGSLAVVWGKRENGLLNLTIAGHCPDKSASGKQIGEFIVVLNGKSSIEKGFDIQSQSDVNFWLAKLGTMTVDADCCTPPPETTAKKDKPDDDKTSKTADSETKEVKKNSTIVLQALLTDRGREFLARKEAFEAKQKLLAQKVDEDAKAKADAAEQERLMEEEKARAEAETRLAQAEAEVALAKAKAELAAKAVKQTSGKAETAEAESKGGVAGDESKLSVAKKSDEEKSDSEKDKSEVKTAEAKTESKTESKAESKTEKTEKVTEAKSNGSEKVSEKKSETTVKVVQQPEEKTETKTKVETVKEVEHPAVVAAATAPIVAKVDSPPARNYNRNDWSAGGLANLSNTSTMTTINTQPVIASALPRNQSSVGWEAPAVPIGPKQPSMTAVLVLPEKALAGQIMTAAVMDANHNPEVGVELSFNGASLTTDMKGQVTFMVPEDATPGHSLNVGMPARTDLSSTLVEIFQPLTASFGQEVPRIDKVSNMVSGRGLLTIDGHNFDGQAEHNRVTVDGINEGQVTAASPVQLKVALPAGLPAGSHTVSVSTSGLRGNPVPFNVVAADVQADSKESRIVVRVRGTTDKVQVHLVNQNPDVIRISRGENIHVTTTGGDPNQSTLGVQRLRKGSYRITAEIE